MSAAPPPRLTFIPPEAEIALLGTLGLIIIGLVAGFIARALVPGKQSMTVQTTLVGIVGSFVEDFSADCCFTMKAV